MYKALTFFRDTLDMGHPYKEGDTYPREGYTPSEERVQSLLSGDNIRGIPVIGELKMVEVAEEKPKKRGKKKE